MTVTKEPPPLDAASRQQSRKPKDRGAKFNEKHALTYGLSICSRSAKDNSVEMVMCKFCVAFGKESASDSARKRRATANIKYFRQPFRADHYLSHLEINHKTKWAQYEHATMPEKEQFFSSVGDDARSGGNSYDADETDADAFSSAAATVAAAATVGMLRSAETTPSKMDGNQRPGARVGPVRLPASEIEKDVVEVLISELFFNENEEQHVTREQVLEMFVKKPGTENYELCIKNKRLYDLAVKFISSGASYRLASRLVQCTKDETKLSHYGGCSDERVAAYVRAILASNLQRIAWMLRAAWGYAIATEVVHHQGTAYLDVRIKVWHNCGLRDFHLFAVPAFDKLPMPVIMDRLERVLGILDPRWRYKLLGTTADGGVLTGRDRAIMSNQQGLAARLTGVAQKPHFYLIWSATYQLELVAKNAVVTFCDRAFYNEFVGVVTALRSHIRRSTTTPFSTSFELHDLSSVFSSSSRGFVAVMVTVIKWLLTEREAVSTFFRESHRELTASWWIGVIVVHRLLAEVDYFLKKLLSMEVNEHYVRDQVNELMSLTVVLKDILGVRRREWESTDIADDAVANDSFVLTFHAAQQFIQNEGGVVAVELFDSLRGLERVQISKGVSQLALDLLTAVTGVAQDGRRYASESAGVSVTPPRVMPYDVYQLGKDDYLKLLLTHEERLRETFTPQEIRRIQNEYYYFVAAIESEPILSGVLKKHGRDTDVSFAWSCLNGCVMMLQAFIGSLASIVPDTSTYSLATELAHLNWEKPDYRLTMVDFALEGILHAQQKLRIEVVDVDHERAATNNGEDDDADRQASRPAPTVDLVTPAGGFLGTPPPEDTTEDEDESMEVSGARSGDGYTTVVC